MTTQSAATLRLMSDLREMQKDAPEVGCGKNVFQDRGCRQPTVSPRSFFGTPCFLNQRPLFSPQGASAAPMSEDNIYLWNATIFGPSDTPWEVRPLALGLPHRH